MMSRDRVLSRRRLLSGGLTVGAAACGLLLLPSLQNSAAAGTRANLSQAQVATVVPGSVDYANVVGVL